MKSVEEDKDKTIILQRKKIEQLSKKNSALEQEVFLLKEENKRLKQPLK